MIKNPGQANESIVAAKEPLDKSTDTYSSKQKAVSFNPGDTCAVQVVTIDALGNRDTGVNQQIQVQSGPLSAADLALGYQDW